MCLHHYEDIPQEQNQIRNDHWLLVYQLYWDSFYFALILGGVLLLRSNVTPVRSSCLTWDIFATQLDEMLTF